MLMKMIYLTFFFTTVIGFSIQAAYVRSFRGVLFEHPKAGAKQLMMVKRGERADELATSGNWVKVNLKGTVGWMMRMQLSDKAIVDKVIYKRSSRRKTSRKRHSIRVRTAHAAVGVKGLRESQMKKLKENQTDFEALAKMESFTVKEEAAMRFVLDYNE